MPISAAALVELDAHGWELYHVAEDIAENHNVATMNRERLIGMIAAWYVEAGKYKVLPVDGSGLQRFAQERPQIAAARTSYTYYPDTQTVPLHVAAKVFNRPHSITADVEIPRGGAEGVLLCQGTGVGGYSFYVKDGRLHYAHNYVGRAIYKVVSDERVPEYRSPFTFTGKIYSVTVDVSGDLIKDDEAELRLVMARQ
jgi:arylsulfatase